jgi:hypothetical protein
MRNEINKRVGQQVEIVGRVSVRYDDSGRVVIGQFDIIENGKPVKGDDHIGINPNNFKGWNHGDHGIVQRGDRVRVVGEVIRYNVKGNRNRQNRGKQNVRFNNIVVFEIID